MIVGVSMLPVRKKYSADALNALLVRAINATTLVLFEMVAQWTQ
jgi:hypothetical protein